MTNKYIAYSFLPQIKGAVSLINPELGYIGLITPPARQSCIVEQKIADFQKSKCNSCPHLTNLGEVTAEVKKLGQIPSSDNLRNWRTNNNKCLGAHAFELGEGCVVGYTFEPTKEIEIETPYLLYLYILGAAGKNKFKLYALDGKQLIKGKLVGKPYLIPNVYEDGKICWAQGKQASASTPTDLLSAYNQFWSAAFTDSLYKKGIPGNVTLEELMLTYNPMQSDAPLEDLYYIDEDAVYMKVNSPGVFYSLNEKLLGTNKLDNLVRTSLKGTKYVAGSISYDSTLTKQYFLNIEGHWFSKESMDVGSNSKVKWLGHAETFSVGYNNPTNILSELYASSDQETVPASIYIPTYSSGEDSSLSEGTMCFSES